MRLIAALSLVLMFASVAQTANDDTKFGTVFSDGEYRELVAKAKSEDKTLLVLVGAQWCHYCVEMKRTIEQMRDRDLKDVVIAMVDTDDSSMKNVAKHIMKGSSIPQIAVYHYRNKHWDKKMAVGQQSKQQLLRMIEAVER